MKSSQIFKVEPQKGIEPKIAYSPPTDDKDTMVAGQQRTSYYCVPGGQAPLPPGEAYLDVFLSSGPLDPQAGGPQNTAYPPAAFPPPTYVRQTFQAPAPAAQIPSGQTYAALPYPQQAPQSLVRFAPAPQAPVYPNQVPPAPVYAGGANQPQNYPVSQLPGPAEIQTRYGPTNGWTRPQPQSWPPANENNNGSYGGQPQNYPAPQPPAGSSMNYYSPAAANSTPTRPPRPTVLRLRRCPRAIGKRPTTAGRGWLRRRQCRLPGAGRSAAAECSLSAGGRSATRLPRPDLPAAGRRNLGSQMAA